MLIFMVSSTLLINKVWGLLYPPPPVHVHTPHILYHIGGLLSKPPIQSSSARTPVRLKTWYFGERFFLENRDVQ